MSSVTLETLRIDPLLSALANIDDVLRKPKAADLATAQVSPNAKREIGNNQKVLSREFTPDTSSAAIEPPPRRKYTLGPPARPRHDRKVRRSRPSPPHPERQSVAGRVLGNKKEGVP